MQTQPRKTRNGAIYRAMRCRASMAIKNNSSNKTVVSPARSSVTPVDVHDDLMARWLRRSGEFWGGCRIMACFGASGSKIPTLVRKAESAVSLLEGRSVVLASPTQKRPLFLAREQLRDAHLHQHGSASWGSGISYPPYVPWNAVPSNFICLQGYLQEQGNGEGCAEYI